MAQLMEACKLLEKLNNDGYSDEMLIEKAQLPKAMMGYYRTSFAKMRVYNSLQSKLMENLGLSAEYFYDDEAAATGTEGKVIPIPMPTKKTETKKEPVITPVKEEVAENVKEETPVSEAVAEEPETETVSDVAGSEENAVTSEPVTKVSRKDVELLAFFKNLLLGGNAVEQMNRLGIAKSAYYSRAAEAKSLVRGKRIREYFEKAGVSEEDIKEIENITMDDFTKRPLKENPADNTEAAIEETVEAAGEVTEIVGEPVVEDADEATEAVTEDSGETVEIADDSANETEAPVEADEVLDDGEPVEDSVEDSVEGTETESADEISDEVPADIPAEETVTESSEDVVGDAEPVNEETPASDDATAEPENSGNTPDMSEVLARLDKIEAALAPRYSEKVQELIDLALKASDEKLDAVIGLLKVL